MKKKLILLITLLLSSCTLMSPEKKVSPDRLELEYNHWLLSVFYLYQDELQPVDNFENTEQLYASLTDQFTRYFPPEEKENTLSLYLESGTPGILGFQYSILHPEDSTENDSLVITRILPNSPALEADLQVDDILLEANGVKVAGVGSADSLYWEATQGDSGTSITLTVLRDGKSIEKTMIKRPVSLPTVYADTSDGIGIITITEFDEVSLSDSGTYEEFTKALSELADQDTIILDLRRNPGGSVGQCVHIADEMIPEGRIIRRIERTINQNNNEAYIDTVDYMAETGGTGEAKVWAVLADSNSASCAEIVTSAMRDRLHAPIIGTTTYGKGIGQVLLSTYADGLAVITSIEFLPESNVSYHHIGIVPDYKTSQDDDAFTMATQVLRGTLSLQKHSVHHNIYNPSHTEYNRLKPLGAWIDRR